MVCRSFFLTGKPCEESSSFKKIIAETRCGVSSNSIKNFPYKNFKLKLKGLFMIRMIANNTSDYVATDVIHNLFCQHAEKYDRLFPDESHHIPGGKPCKFKHTKKKIFANKSNEQNQNQRHFFNLTSENEQQQITTENEKPLKLNKKKVIINSSNNAFTNYSSDENVSSFKVYKKNDLVMMRSNDSTLYVLPEWDGPYKVIEREEENYYNIQSDSGGPKIKVHVKRLRPFKSVYDTKRLATKISDCDLS